MSRSLFTARLVLIAMLALPAAAGPFHVTSTGPFEAHCTGPLGAITVSERATAQAVGTRSRIRQAVRKQHSVHALQRSERALRFLQAAGALSPEAKLRFPRTIVHVVNGRMATPDLDRTLVTGRQVGDPANEIRFSFEGWEGFEADRDAFQAYLANAVPVARQVYGPPAFDLDVKVILDPELQSIQGGTYDTATNEIRIPEPSGNFTEDSFVLMLLVLRAFRDEALIFFDAWEEGMARAAATAVQIAPGVSPGYNPIDPGPFYAGSVYEAENQRPLGNPTFYPQSGFSGMLVWRIAMSFAAWLKCWVESPSFFADFNAAYYAQYSQELAGDSRRLRLLAEQALPQVENLGFQDWIRRQHALDTGVTAGEKLYVWNIPFTDSVALIAEHYITNPEGDETPRGGRIFNNYFNYNFTIDLFAEEGYTIDLPSTGDGAGEGFLLPTFFNIGGPQRITVRMTLGDIVRDFPFPYGQRGFEAGENNIYGAIIGPTTGTIDITGGTSPQGIEVQRGSWGTVATSGALTPRQMTITYNGEGDQTFARTVNVMFDSYIVFLEAGSQSRIEKGFLVGLNGLHLISLPFVPLETDEAAVFDLDPQRFLLARWDPQRDGGSYRIYPDVDPIRPGLGYFLKIFQDINLDTIGVEPAADSDVVVELKPGWNMIGSGFRTDVPVTRLRFRRGSGSLVDLDTAVANRWVRAAIFEYSQDQGYLETDTLHPFMGYWLKSLVSPSLQLVIPGPGSSTGAGVASRQARSSDPEPAWRLPLMVSVGSLHSASSYLGVSTQATPGFDPTLDLEAPPNLPQYVALRFIHDDWAAASGHYVSDIRANTREPWAFEITTSAGGSEVEVSWPELSRVPKDLRPVLVDLDAGARRYMRTVAAYRYRAGAPGQPRRFAVEFQHLGGALQITSLAQTGAGRAAAVAYSLSAPAIVTCTVRNIAGRPVRRLVQGAALGAGSHEVVWGLQDSGGRFVPNGSYLFEIRADGEDGQSVRRLLRLTVVR